MLFLTNKRPTSQIDSSITFDENDCQGGHEVYFCNRVGASDYKEVGSTPFMDAMRSSKYKQILLYIHGFNNYMERDVFKRTREMQAMLDAEDKNKTLVIPLIWPTSDKIGLARDYYSDQKSADNSAFAFARALSKFVTWQQASDGSCLRPMSILAHSMGNRVLRETIKNWKKYDLPNGVPSIFRNIFMVAADVVNETLEEGEDGHFICQSAKNVVVYYAYDDLAMPASKALNLGGRIASRRLGMTGPENSSKVPRNVHSVDCSAFNNSYDFPKGHSYFLKGNNGKPGKVFNHILSILQTGRLKQDINTEL